MINDILLNYGVLGLWTVTLLYEKFNSDKKQSKRDTELKQVIQTNTVALTEVRDSIRGCLHHGNN